jgi:hypothetical protein
MASFRKNGFAAKMYLRARRHHIGRPVTALGHDVRLIPAQGRSALASPFLSICSQFRRTAGVPRRGPAAFLSVVGSPVWLPPLEGPALFPFGCMSQAPCERLPKPARILGPCDIMAQSPLMVRSGGCERGARDEQLSLAREQERIVTQFNSGCCAIRRSPSAGRTPRKA